MMQLMHAAAHGGAVGHGLRAASVLPLAVLAACHGLCAAAP